MPGIEGPLLIDRLTYAQAAVLLGVHPKTVARMIRRGELTAPPNGTKAGLLRSDVERLSLSRWRPGDRTWLTATQLAEALGISTPQVYQLTSTGWLPYEWSPDGRQLFRPTQLTVTARARRQRLGTGAS